MVEKLLSFGISQNLGWQNQPTVFRDFSQMPYVSNVEPQEPHSRKKTAFKIAKFLTLTVLCLLIGVKGSFKKLRSKVDQSLKNLGDKKAQMERGSRKGPMFYLREGLRKCAEYAKAIFNLAPLKDVVLSKAMEKTKPTKFLYEKLTNWFEHISYRTVKKAYAKSRDKIEHAFAHYEEINKTKNIPAEIRIAFHNIVDQVREDFDRGFSETATKKRLFKIKNGFDGYDKCRTKKQGLSLRDEVWNETYYHLKGIKEKKNNIFKSFVSERLAVGAKIDHAKRINPSKLLISNSMTTLCEDSFDVLIHTDAFVDATDNNIRTPIKKIATILNEYKKELESDTFEPGQFFKEKKLDVEFEDLKKSFIESNKYDKSKVKLVLGEIDDIVERVKDHRRGGMNQILHIYKPYLTPKEFKKALKITYSATNSFDKAVDLESDKMFDKVRDLKIGSAPKDVLMLLLPVGGVGLAVHKADTKEKKRSVMIKYGIPIVGAVAITMYCTIGLISAGPSLLIGTLSGFALNQAGVEADSLMKKFKAKYKKITSAHQYSK